MTLTEVTVEIEELDEQDEENLLERVRDDGGRDA